MPDPMHFEQHAEVYERARPPYPHALWRRLSELGILSAGRRALDLGAGTGQATGPLLEAGLRVTAVEPGTELARRLRSGFPAAKVIESTIEDADIPPDSFDLAVAATSVHWFDLDRVLPKIHRALVDGGRFVVWRNVYGDTSVAESPFRERVAEIVSKRNAPDRPGPAESDTVSWSRMLASGGYFEVEPRDEFRWSIELDEQQIHDLFTTFSDWSPAEAEEAAQAVHDLGGRVTEHYVTPLIVLRRT
jgi:SAM-dependent methyltransferase